MRLKIKYKLFFTLLLTSVVASLALHFYVKETFDRSFKEYVKGQEMEQLQQLTAHLERYYGQDGSWSFMVGNDGLWMGLHKEIADSMPRLTDGRPLRQDGRKPPPPPDRGQGGNPFDMQGAMGPRIVLYDADKKWIIGGHGESQIDQKLLPLQQGTKTIGYLGLVPAKKLHFARDQHFIQEQARSFALIPVIVVVLSLVLSFPIAAHLLRPIHAMTVGTGKLISGRFNTRIPVTTSDELGTLSNDFNSLAETLEKNEQNRKQWVADISHELRTPLSVLRGEVEALQDGIRQPDKDTLQALHGEVMHLERIVGDLYELSMSDIGALSYKRVTVEPAGILMGTVDLFELRFAEKNITVTTDFAVESHCPLNADPDRLQQLFSNILENSLRYTDEGGTVALKLAPEKEYAVISIQDSTPTVSSDQLAKLFERFYRVDGSRNRKTGGAGLGLAICKNIVEAHGGTISAASSSFGGVLIKIKIPMAT